MNGLNIGSIFKFFAAERAARLVVLLAVCFSWTASANDRQVVSRQIPASAANLPAIGQLPGSTTMDLAIGLPLRNQEGLKGLLQRLYDPASSDYRNYLRPEQFAEMFGPLKEDYEALIDFARSNNLVVTATHPNRTLLDVRGPVADIQKALHITLRQFRHPVENRMFFAPDRDPSIDLTVPILSISGLDNYIVPHPKGLHPAAATDDRDFGPKGGTGPGGSYAGGDFRAAYAPGVSLTGLGQSVGLLEFEGYYESDITNYEGQCGYTNVTLTNVLIDGATGLPDTNAQEISEVSLDIELAIAMAPGLSQVMVYEVGPPSTYADDMLNRMATDNAAKQLSSSWNFLVDQSVEQIFQQFAAQGQSFFDASGDVDAYTGSVPGPDDNPYITIVGGTTLTTSSNGAWMSETTWNRGGGVGSSGGISATFAIPYWQQPVSMVGNGGSATMRNIPDVALTAENIRVIYDNGSAGALGGTSCAAPLWAGFTAMVNQQAAMSGQPSAGFLNPALYWIGQGTNYTNCFHDITTGNNTSGGSHNLFQAVAGYDLCTGWGTPTGSNLITALSTPEPLRLVSNANFAAIGLTGGPFSPPTANIGLSNISSQSLAWAITNVPAWATVTPTNGTLSPGSVVNLAVGVNTSAAALPVGNYTNAIWIRDKTDGFALSGQFTLQVQATLVQNGGFETGDLTGWAPVRSLRVRSMWWRDPACMSTLANTAWKLAPIKRWITCRRRFRPRRASLTCSRFGLTARTARHPMSSSWAGMATL